MGGGGDDTGYASAQPPPLARRYEEYGYDGLFDRRTQRPSPRRAPFKEVEKMLRLYREKYQGFNVYHFHRTVSRDHGITLSYNFVKKALQEAGLVKKKKKRGPHRKKRERRASYGEILHIDGSPHAWLASAPGEVVSSRSAANNIDREKSGCGPLDSR